MEVGPQSVYGLVVAAFPSLWWLAGMRFPYLIFGPFFKFAPVWQAFYVPMLLLTLAEIARQSVGLIRPQWEQLQSAARLVINSAGLLVCYFLLRAGLGLIIAVTTSAVIVLKELWRLVRSANERSTVRHVN